jgi:hypothetical protein
MPIVVTAAPAMAQDAGAVNEADRAVAERMMSSGGRLTRNRSRSDCLNSTRQGEIVVCAPDDGQFRVPSTAESDPGSDQALNDGQLHTPDVAGGGIFRGKATMGGGCILGSCPPQFYIIDLSTIPLAPAGSDADKIARGEMRAP